MFLVIVDYRKPLEEVERFLAEHRAFLDRYYARGELLCSGPQQPRTGGVIVSRATERAAVEAFVREDPFFREGIADFGSSDSSRPNARRSSKGCVSRWPMRSVPIGFSEGLLKSASRLFFHV